MSKPRKAAHSKKSTRIKACELAAMVMASRPDDNPSPLLWSMAVFFETYINGGAAATQEDFGPLEPVELKVAPLDREAKK